MSRLVIAGLASMAEVMDCSKKTLYKWIREREFPAFKMDGVWRCMPKDVEIWLAKQRAMAEGEKDSAVIPGGRFRAKTSKVAPKGRA